MEDTKGNGEGMNEMVVARLCKTDNCESNGAPISAAATFSLLSRTRDHDGTKTRSRSSWRRDCTIFPQEIITAQYFQKCRYLQIKKTFVEIIGINSELQSCVPQRVYGVKITRESRFRHVPDIEVTVSRDRRCYD